jgi:DNA-entry nuclease
MSRKNKKLVTSLLSLIVLIAVVSYQYILPSYAYKDNSNNTSDVISIPSYDNEPYKEVNNNKPTFTDSEKELTEKEEYSDLDSLGRVGVAFALVSKSTMPTTKRGSIGMIKPAGWHTVKYDFVDGKYLYNRCHLIAHQLTGQNANPKNLMTCTRSMNVDGMLPFENKVANYIKETNNHVLYRVTPVFDGDNLVANGAYMEAYSIEDKGKLSFNVYVYNVQKGVAIDYKTGESKLEEE